YLQNEHYALWEIIEFGDSYKAPLKETGKGPSSESSVKKKGRNVIITTEDMQKRRNDVKARTTLLLDLPNEHQLRFCKLQAIVSHLEFMDVKIEQDDLNQMFLTSLAPEWQMYTIVWRNRDNLDTMSLDYVGKGKVHTASVPTASTQVSTASSDVAAPSLSHDTVCAYIASHSNGSLIKYKDITQIDEDDIEEMDIKWNMTLLTDDDVPTEFALMAKSSSSLENKEIKFCEKIRGLERDVEVRNNKIEHLENELEQVKKEKEGLDNKLTGFEKASKDLDNLLGSQRLDKNKEGLAYSVVPPSCSSLFTYQETLILDRKSPVKYAEMYRNTSKGTKVRGNQRNWNNLKSQQLGKDFLMQNKACFKCGYFDHLASNCGEWVDKGKTWLKNNFAHKNVTPRAILLNTGRTPIVVNRLNMNVAQPKITSFTKITHSNVKRPFQGKLAVRTQPRVLRFSTVTGKIPTVDSKFSTTKSTFTTDLGNKGKVMKDLETREKLLRPQLVGFGDLNKILLNKDSGCSQHMTGNISYLYEYEPYDGGYVSFGHGGGKIT
nr:ribonuclease H-like domain-containing protein [Tanacetum cinerariifolium]